MRVFLHELRAEQRLFWRSRELAFFTFALPVLFLFLLGSVYGDSEMEDGVRGADYLLAGLMGYAAIATSFAGLAIMLVIRRESGVLKRIRATPLPAATYVGALLVSNLVAFVLTAAALLALGRVAFGTQLPTESVTSFAVVVLLGAAAFAALGVGLAVLIRSAEGASAVVNAVFLPMAFLSGSFFSPQAFPGVLQTLAEVLPLTHFIRLVRATMLDGVPLWDEPAALGALAAWGALGLVVALRRFRWEPTTEG